MYDAVSKFAFECFDQCILALHGLRFDKFKLDVLGNTYPGVAHDINTFKVYLRLKLFSVGNGVL